MPIFIPSYQIILENNEIILFYPRRPLALGHLIIAFKNNNRLEEISTKTMGSFFVLLKNIITKLKIVYPFDGYNIFCNVGAQAGQTLPKIHFHFLPRYKNEVISPFKLLNNKKKYKEVKALTPTKLKQEVKKLKKILK